MRQDKIWNYYQNQKVDSFADAHVRLSYLVKIIDRKVGKKTRLLNIGVGDGFIEDLGKEIFTEVWSLDPDNNAIKKLERRLDIKGIVGYAENMNLPSDTFSVVTISEVLEHLNIHQIKKAINNIYDILEPGGLLIGSVPFNENLNKNIVVCPKCGAVFHRWGHNTSFTLESMHETLSQVFKKVDVQLKYFYSWSSLNWKGKIFSFIKRYYYFLACREEVRISYSKLERKRFLAGHTDYFFFAIRRCRTNIKHIGE